MRLGAHQLSYNLYTDAAPQHGLGRRHGRQLGAAPGAYSDTLNVTLTYY